MASLSDEINCWHLVSKLEARSLWAMTRTWCCLEMKIFFFPPHRWSDCIINRSTNPERHQWNKQLPKASVSMNSTADLAFLEHGYLRNKWWLFFSPLKMPSYVKIRASGIYGAMKFSDHRFWMWTESNLTGKFRLVSYSYTVGVNARLYGHFIYFFKYSTNVWIYETELHLTLAQHWCCIS